MNLVKLSLATTIAIGSSACAADSLADAFNEAKVSGAIQAYYWTRENNVKKDADIMNFGLDLSYETSRFHGFGLKATVQSSSSPFIDNDAKEVFKGDMHGSGASLSEAYLSYAIGKTTAQVGRMYFATPLIYGSGSRINKEAFEGALITNSDLPDTKVTLGYVNKMQNRTDGNGNFGKFSKLNFANWQGDLKDGAYTLVVENSSLPYTNLTFAYLDAEDLLKTSYAEASFKKDIFGLAAQYYYSDVDANADSSDLFGVKGTVQLGKLGLFAAYSTTGDYYVRAGLGNGADYAFTTSTIIGDVYSANNDTYKVGASYELTSALNVAAHYLLVDRDKKDEKYSYTNFSANYKFSGELKGLSAALIYDVAGKDKEKDGLQDEELRLNLTYSF